MVSFPDEIKSAESNHFFLEVSSRYRFLQPAPTPQNAAKALLVYRQLDDGLGKTASAVFAYPGSPVLLAPGFVYVVRSDLTEALFSDNPVADNQAFNRIRLMALISDDYRPEYGAEGQIFFRSSDPARLPTGGGDTEIFAKFPNPGVRRIGFWFQTAGTGNTVTARVQALGFGGASNVQTVVGPGHPENVFVVGTADFVPIEWRIELSDVGPAPTSATLDLSFIKEP